MTIKWWSELKCRSKLSNKGKNKNPFLNASSDQTRSAAIDEILFYILEIDLSVVFYHNYSNVKKAHVKKVTNS